MSHLINMLNVPLLAGAVDVILPIVVVVGYLLVQIWNAIQGKNQPGQPNRPGQANRPGQGRGTIGTPPTPGGQQKPPQAQLNEEIDQFLKRTTQRRGEKQRRGMDSSDQPRVEQAAKPREGLASRAKAALKERESAKKRAGGRSASRSSVSDSVQKHLGGKQLEQHADHLAYDIEQSDENMAEHLDKVFGHHHVGSISTGDLTQADDSESTGASDRPNASAEILGKLLGSQENIRQAMLLKEILERPVDRW